TAEALGLASRAGTPSTPPSSRGDSGERARLLDALEATDWNLSRAAARLGLPRNTLRYRMDKQGLTAGRGSGAASVGAPASPAPPAARPPAQTVGVRWEPRRVTLLCVALQPGETSSGAADASRFMETVLDKIQSFGGQVDELSPRGAVAAFGLEPEEDAPQRAAHVALALLKAGTRARA